jgi:hypothetical protein
MGSNRCRAPARQRIPRERCDHRLHPLPGPCRCPCACTASTAKARSGHQPSATDLLFITLPKSEALYSPSTRYRDLALGPSLFHWESQRTTTAAATATGKRYNHHAERGSRVLLFVYMGFAT